LKGRADKNKSVTANPDGGPPRSQKPVNTTSIKPNTLPPGPHRGFAKLKSQPGIFRCKLRPDANKKKPEHSDYHGVLQLDGGAKASVLLWVHADGSLGLRLDLSQTGQCLWSTPHALFDELNAEFHAQCLCAAYCGEG
jgi:hypothetical protein